MIRKFLFAFCFLLSFFFMFLFGFDKINILAYTEYDNTLGTYPAKLDIDNYDTKNILYYSDYSRTACGVTIVYDSETNIFTLNGTVTGSNCTILAFYNINNQDLYYSTLNFYYVSGTSNNLYADNTGGNYNLRIVLRDVNGWFKIANDLVNFNNNYNSNQISRINNSAYTSDDINLTFDIHTGFNSANNVTFNNYQFKLMFTNDKNGYLSTLTTPYSSPFYFGNMVGYQLNLYNTKSYNITTNVSIKNYDNQIVNKSVTVNANSYYELKGNISTNSQGVTDTRFYLPYNISSDGIISMDYKLSINITNPDIVIKSDENIQNDSYFLFEPVFNGYYKGELTNNLYFKNSYVFNSLMYTGINARGQGLNSLYFNCYGNVLDNYCIYDSLTIAPNTTENVLAFNVTSTGIRNNINFNDVFIYDYTDSYGFDSTSTLFSFQLNIGDTNTSLTSGVSYDINMSELTLLVINNNSTTSPLPNNPDTYNKYNVCDAWYDIPCQLGNAITYVIYEAPIISPVLTFIVTFITMFSSLVSFVDLFKSFGVVFGCFVIYMFIELLHKYSN